MNLPNENQRVEDRPRPIRRWVAWSAGAGACMGVLSILQVLLLLRFRLQPNWMHLFAGLSVVVFMSGVGAVAGLIAYALSRLKE